MQRASDLKSAFQMYRSTSLSTRQRHVLWILGVIMVLGVSIFIALLVYMVSRWYAASDWKNTKARWEAKGETFDPNAFIPAPLDDDKNLAALPLFKMEMASIHGKVQLAPVTLYKALRNEEMMDDGGTRSPLMGALFKGEINSESITQTGKVVATEYIRIFKSAPGQLTELEQFDALYPFINELREASKVRTSCRFAYEPNVQPSVDRLHVLIVDQISVGRLLGFHALLGLNSHNAELAISDLRLISILASGVHREPGVIPGLIHCVFVRYMLSVVEYGLGIHIWNAAQLSEIDGILKDIDLLADFQKDIRSETVDEIGNILYAENLPHQKNHVKINGIVHTLFYDYNKVLVSNFLFRYVNVVDPHSHRAFMDLANALNREADQVKSSWMPDLFFIMAAPTLHVHKSFFLGQVDLDETRIACALEAGYLNQHAYPENLTGLKLLSGDELPHDIINGEPYHYRLQKNGTFLLYSVGWNQKDDGGVTVYLPDKPGTMDYQNGDWVWPCTR